MFRFLGPALNARIKAVLGIFLDCKRARPDLTEELQQQVDAALRQACRNDDLKWVSLLMWLGANPRSKGFATEDLDNADAFEDADYRQSALQIACGSRDLKILQRLKPDPAVDDLRELMAAAATWHINIECVAHLVRLGARVNDKSDGGSTVLDRCLRNFGWKEQSWDYEYRKVAVPVASLRQSLDALRFLLEEGARWTPDERSITDTRRSLYRLEREAIAFIIDLLRKHRACEAKVVNALTRTPKMRSILNTVDPSQPENKRRGRPVGSKRRPNAIGPSKSVPTLPQSRYDRVRLYEEVWAEPTQKVAKHYGVSDVAIAKACTLLDIPKPPRGYWAKKAAGRKLPIRPLLPKY